MWHRNVDRRIVGQENFEMFGRSGDDPTNLFTILELQNPLHDVPEVHKIPQSPDLGALKL